MAGVEVICQNCKHEFAIYEHENTKPCPKCGSVASRDNAKLNPRFAEILSTALRSDLTEMQDLFEARITAAIRTEGRGIIKGWLEFIPDYLEAVPACTRERQRLVREMCQRHLSSLGTLQERLKTLGVLTEGTADPEVRELIENLNRIVERSGEVEARTQLVHAMSALDEFPGLTAEQKERARSIIRNYMEKLL